MLLRVKSFFSSAVGIVTSVISVLGAVAMTALYVAAISTKADIANARLDQVEGRQNRQGTFMEKQADTINTIREDTARTKVMVEILLERSNASK